MGATWTEGWLTGALGAAFAAGSVAIAIERGALTFASSGRAARGSRYRHLTALKWLSPRNE
jgi:hypothetical protein